MICPKKLGRFSWSIGLGIDVGSDTFVWVAIWLRFLSQIHVCILYMSGDISVDFSGSAKDDKVIKVINIKMSILST